MSGSTNGINSKVSEQICTLSYYKCANYAFTLAEVLITIGVIGIVAAIALPSLINHYNDKVLETRYKKSKNILINGYKLMMAKEQVFNMKDLSMVKCRDMNCIMDVHKDVFKIIRDASGSDMSEAFAQEYTIPYHKNKTELGNITMLPSFQTTDGMSYAILSLSNTVLELFADLNGKSEPNTLGKDFFKFAISGDGVFIDLTDSLIPEKPSDELQACIDNPENCTSREQCLAANEYGCCYSIIWTSSGDPVCVTYCR